MLFHAYLDWYVVYCWVLPLLFWLNRSSCLNWALSTETLPAGMCWWGRTRCWRSRTLEWLEMKTSTSRPQMGSSLFAGWLLSPLWTECSPPRVMCEWRMHSPIALLVALHWKNSACAINWLKWLEQWERQDIQDSKLGLSGVFYREVPLS